MNPPFILKCETVISDNSSGEHVKIEEIEIEQDRLHIRGKCKGFGEHKDQWYVFDDYTDLSDAVFNPSAQELLQDD